jgi:hypothetical protein
VGHTAEVVALDHEGKVKRTPVDAADRSLWPDPNPALVYGRTEMAFLEEQFRILGPALYAREHLGVWDDPPLEDGASGFDMKVWESLADPDAARGERVVFGVDVGEDRLAHIAVAWRRVDGAFQVMLADSGLSPLSTPARLVELAARWGGSVMLGGPASVLESQVRASKVMSGVEFADACGQFEDLVRGRQVHHGNQESLNGAVRAARWRSVGGAGQRALQLRDAPAVGPLAAAVRAVWGAGMKRSSSKPYVSFR